MDPHTDNLAGTLLSKPTQAQEAESPRKPGPVPQINTRMTSVMVEPDLIEWAKRQKGGLSETVRRTLRAAREQSQNGLG